MLNKLNVVLRRRWALTLIMICFLAFVVNVAIFYPGYMSRDTIINLQQAKNLIPTTDRQPPMLAFVWQMLLIVTGKISSMLVFQLSILWVGVYTLSVFTYKLTKRVDMSLLPIVACFSPLVINISGVIWSDNQMAYTLLLAVALLLLSSSLPRSRKTFAMYAVTLILIFYAESVRNNAILAVPPILYLLVNESGLLKKTWHKYLTTFALLLLIIAFSSIFKTMVTEQHIAAAPGPMTDDIVHIVSAQDIQMETIASPLKKSLLSIQACVKKEGILIDVLPCTSKQDRDNILKLHSEDVQSAWIKMLKRQPGSYISRRATVFVYVLFPPDGRGYIWHAGIDSNTLGLEPKFKSLGEINRMYVFNFGYKHFKFLYEPWFWLGLNIWCMYKSSKMMKYRRYVVSVGLSAVLYILGFAPTGVASDYRYIYWPVFAGMLSVLLLIISKPLPKVRGRYKKLNEVLAHHL